MKNLSLFPPFSVMSPALIDTIRHQDEMSNDEIVKVLVKERRAVTISLHMIGVLLLIVSASASAILTVFLNGSNEVNGILGALGVLLALDIVPCVIQLFLCSAQRMLLSEDIHDISNGGTGSYLSKMGKTVRDIDKQIQENR